MPVLVKLQINKEKVDENESYLTYNITPIDHTSTWPLYLLDSPDSRTSGATYSLVPQRVSRYVLENIFFESPKSVIFTSVSVSSVASKTFSGCEMEQHEKDHFWKD